MSQFPLGKCQDLIFKTADHPTAGNAPLTGRVAEFEFVFTLPDGRKLRILTGTGTRALMKQQFLQEVQDASVEALFTASDVPEPAVVPVPPPANTPCRCWQVQASCPQCGIVMQPMVLVEEQSPTRGLVPHEPRFWNATLLRVDPTWCQQCGYRWPVHMLDLQLIQVQ